MIPIVFSTWFINKFNGIIISVISAFIWIFIDFYGKNFFLFDNFIIYWNIIVRFVFFIIFVNILSFLKDTLEKSEKNARNDFLTGVINARYFYDENGRAGGCRIPIGSLY